MGSVDNSTGTIALHFNVIDDPCYSPHHKGAPCRSLLPQHIDGVETGAGG